jgi:hypothetical protein
MLYIINKCIDGFIFHHLNIFNFFNIFIILEFVLLSIFGNVGLIIFFSSTATALSILSSIYYLNDMS